MGDRKDMPAILHDHIRFGAIDRQCPITIAVNPPTMQGLAGSQVLASRAA
jgi:hypothetical protein